MKKVVLGVLLFVGIVSATIYDDLRDYTKAVSNDTIYLSDGIIPAKTFWYQSNVVIVGSGNTKSQGMVFYDCSKISIVNILFDEAMSGLSFPDGSCNYDITIENNTFLNNDYAIIIRDSQRFLVKGNDFGASYGACPIKLFYFWGANNIFAQNNNFYKEFTKVTVDNSYEWGYFVFDNNYYQMDLEPYNFCYDPVYRCLTHTNIQTTPIGSDAESPVILSIPTPAPAPVSSPVTISAEITDNIGVASVQYSYGTINGEMTNNSGVYSATVTLPATPEVVYFTVTAKDAANNATTETIMLVAYDPTAGFVTGGGWFNSPEGAYAADPTLTGKATFGFVSRYKKGASVPQGNTEFQFKAGNLKFKSTSYQWLVVAGRKAMFKGVGKINDAGEYKFLISAIDNNTVGDQLRVKIVDLNEEVVYDNLKDADENADPQTVIGGGEIKIHK
jgi:parallel beta-helix repeat protein